MAVQIENLPQMFHGCACAECERDRQRVRDIIHALNVAVQKWYDRAHESESSRDGYADALSGRGEPV